MWYSCYWTPIINRVSHDSIVIKPVLLPDSPDGPASGVVIDGIFSMDFSIVWRYCMLNK
jgi:hypothetical protein